MLRRAETDGGAEHGRVGHLAEERGRKELEAAMPARSGFKAALAIVVVAIVLAAGGGAQAAMIGVNYAVAGSNVTGTAGAVPQANWNNENIAHSSSSKTGGLTSLVDDSGAVVPGMSTSWIANAAYRNGAAGSGDDTTLLYGGLESQQTSYGTTAITISGIPYAEYDLYVYVKGWSAGRTGEARLEGVASSEIGFNTYMDFPGTHSRATSTATQGTYVLWEGLTAETTIVDIRRVSNNVIIAGFQIVQVPEPGTLMLLAVGILGLRLRRRRP